MSNISHDKASHGYEVWLRNNKSRAAVELVIGEKITDRLLRHYQDLWEARLDTYVAVNVFNYVLAP